MGRVARQVGPLHTSTPVHLKSRWTNLSQTKGGLFCSAPATSFCHYQSLTRSGKVDTRLTVIANFSSNSLRKNRMQEYFGSHQIFNFKLHFSSCVEQLTMVERVKEHLPVCLFATNPLPSTRLSASSHQHYL